MKKIISIVLVLALCMVADVANADFAFGTPTEVPNVNTSSEEFNASISADGLSLYFISNRPGGMGGRDIWVTTRETTDDDWGEPVNLGPPINTAAGEWGVSISYDGLSLYFDTKQSGASGAVNDLWVATRATTNDDWSNPVNLGPAVNSSADDYTPSISSDELELYFTSGPGRGGHGNYDIWVSRRETKYDPWGTAVNLGPTVNSPAFDLDPGISADGRALFFTSVASDGSDGGYGQTDLWVTRRATTDDPWGQPINLGPTINSSAFEQYRSVSADGSTLFFRYSPSDLRTGGDIWQAPIIPIVDFNADETVDIKDLLILVESWGQNNPLVDIGPTPLGDGVANAADLEVLMSYWQQELDDPTLLAHWAFDETEGTVAYDSAGLNDGTVIGLPAWQPEGGMVDGALEFNGATFVVADSVLDPSGGPFSVLAWIKGGAPGQVLISQVSGVNWLMADELSGTLMTELRAPTRDNKRLVSETAITDGDWHRVGFAWDGSVRSLYVDGVLVVSDTRSGLTASDGSLIIGRSSAMTPGTFFTGLGDDVRICNRVVRP